MFHSGMTHKLSLVLALCVAALTWTGCGCNGGEVEKGVADPGDSNEASDADRAATLAIFEKNSAGWKKCDDIRREAVSPTGPLRGAPKEVQMEAQVEQLKKSRECHDAHRELVQGKVKEKVAALGSQVDRWYEDWQKAQLTLADKEAKAKADTAARNCQKVCKKHPDCAAEWSKKGLTGTDLDAKKSAEMLKWYTDVANDCDTFCADDDNYAAQSCADKLDSCSALRNCLAF